jgi:hypothetical protein
MLHAIAENTIIIPKAIGMYMSRLFIDFVESLIFNIQSAKDAIIPKIKMIVTIILIIFLFVLVNVN